MQLADGRLDRPVRLPVDDHAAGAADALAAVVVERDRLLVGEDQLLVEDVEHLEEGHVLGDVVEGVIDHRARCVRTLLPPHPKGDLHA
jgi:hypothetical protein